MFPKISAGIVAAMIFFAATSAYAQTPPNVPISADSSENWAGYVATGSTYSGIGGSWTVPTPSESASEPIASDATWVGIGGVSSTDLIQAGTQAITQNGVITYQAWYETLPQYQQQIPLTIHGGDSVTVSLHEVATNDWQLSFSDNTTGQQYQTNIAYVSSHSSADWIEEMPIGATNGGIQQYLPLDSFGTVQFTGSYALSNGAEETLANAGAQSIAMVSGGGALAIPSTLGSDGASFSVTRSNLPASSEQYGTQTGRGWHRNGVGIQSFTPGQKNNNNSRRQIGMPFFFGPFGNNIRIEFTFWR